MDDIKHCPNLSYFVHLGSSFSVSIKSLDCFHLNERVYIMWSSTVVPTDNAKDYASEAEEGG